MSLALLFVLSASALAPRSLALGSSFSQKPPVPDSGALFGGAVAMGDHTGNTQQIATTSVEDLIGRKLTLERMFYDWKNVWPSAYDYWSRDQGRIAFISWGPRLDDENQVQWADIAAGRYDADIDARAESIKQFRTPFFFIFNHEPEPKQGQPLPPGTPAEFVAAWQHIHDRFVADGVTNILYVLTLLSSDFVPGGVADNYWPGDQYVDLIAADGYNWYGCDQKPHAKWDEFSKIFDDFYAYGVAKRKQLMIGEYATGEDPLIPGRKAAWFAAAAAQIKLWPQIKGVAYYDNGYAETGCDFWIDSSPSALAAFTAIGADPYFNPATDPPPNTKADAYADVIDAGFSNPVGDVLQGGTIDWLGEGPRYHTVTDDSGMDLFDSGTIGLGDSFSFMFPGAGNYTYACTRYPSMTGTIKVPMLVDPLSGRLNTIFTVTWAAIPAPQDHVYDIQIQRPGQITWVNWLSGQTGTSSTFDPDAGPGLYAFRARFHDTLDHASSDWSKVLTVTVTR